MNAHIPNVEENIRTGGTCNIVKSKNNRALKMLGERCHVWGGMLESLILCRAGTSPVPTGLCDHP